MVMLDCVPAITTVEHTARPPGCEHSELAPLHVGSENLHPSSATMR
jgi:hypothetical protein